VNLKHVYDSSMFQMRPQGLGKTYAIALCVLDYIEMENGILQIL
jgi:hypothetical protein